MRWNRIAKSSLTFSAHTSLFCFTLLLVLKLDHLVSLSWWIVFFPLFLFHVVVARKRSSLPGPSVAEGRYVEPLHLPLFIAFELLLFAHLQGAYVSLKIVFLPLLAFAVAIFVDSFRMCKALLQERSGLFSDVILEALPHFWIAISMVFFFVGTVFTLRKLSGETSLGWWDVFLWFGIAECFVLLVCTKCCNPVVYYNSQIHVGSSSSTAIRYLDWNSGTVGSREDISENRIYGLYKTVGYVTKILIICFQILLCMRLEGKPAAARFIPLPVVFSPIFLVQGLGVLFAASNLVKNIITLLPAGAGRGIYSTYATRSRDSLGSLQRGCSRVLCSWSTVGGNREEQARIYPNGSSGYNTFSGYPPEITKRLPKRDLTGEVRRLQAALKEKTEITKSNQQSNERLQDDETLCKICFEREINTVLLPCQHRMLCSICGEQCQKCPICRGIIKQRLRGYDV